MTKAHHFSPPIAPLRDDTDTDIFDLVASMDCDSVDEESCDYIFCSLREGLSDLTETCEDAEEYATYCKEVEACFEIYFCCGLESCPLGERQEDADPDDFNDCVDKYVDCTRYINY